ncbi:HDOD domain-containing protein [Planctomycetes bacterium TBK1r]|uniref:HDOD domain protein n=1 Tax=Stieleria magnilauensis TaxID=2527963 RepID=A0ABX5XZX4_9BACT|nr:HDOD domain protein [Planctomycetes bacterium TBK1r]
MTPCPPCEPTVDCNERANFQFEIPRFSATASQLVETLNQTEANVPAVVQLIECEPTISSQVLGLANSPIYGASRAITTIGHAVVVLGFRCVAQQAIASASGALFKAKDAACQAHRLDTYIQSLGVATTARFIAKRTKTTNPDEAFLCGVVHDIGKLILFQHAGEAYAGMLDESPHEKSLAPEIESYGITHATLGRQCGVAWSLPTQMCITIANHHLPLNEATDPLSRTLICAAYLAKKWQLGFCEDAFSEDSEMESELCDFQDPDLAAECREQFEAIRDICLS